MATSFNLNKFKAMISVNGAFVHEEVKNNAKAPDKKELSPAIFLGYKPFEDVDFNLRAFATSCREDEYIFGTEIGTRGEPNPDAKVLGFYILNEGNMGMNRASIDFYDFRKAQYITDIYS